MGNSTEKKQLSALVQDEVVEIDLREVFFTLLDHWRSILLALLIGAAVFGAYHNFLLTPTYKADASIYITNTSSSITFSDLQLSSALTDDYTNIIRSRTVLNDVIDELGLDLDYKALSKLITVENPNSTHIVNMSVVCDDPELSRDIANALMNIGVNQIYQIVGTGEPTIIDYSVAEAVEDVTPGLSKFMLIGGLLGALIVCVIAVIRMMMDSTMKTEEDIEKYLQIPVLAAVPYYKTKK